LPTPLKLLVQLVLVPTGMAVGVVATCLLPVLYAMVVSFKLYAVLPFAYETVERFFLWAVAGAPVARFDHMVSALKERRVRNVKVLFHPGDSAVLNGPLTGYAPKIAKTNILCLDGACA
jgi:hypothetical protein